MKLTQERIKYLFNYSKETGIFTRRVTTSSNAKKGFDAGSPNKSGYRHIRIDGKLYLSHRLAWLYETGEFPDFEIDHINHIKDDNRIVNLRSATRSDNNKNNGIRSTNSSGYTGVCFRKSAKKWIAHIRVDSKRIHLGYHSSIDLAIEARKNAESKYLFHENHGIKIKNNEVTE